jgi:hypothetical protein
MAQKARFFAPVIRLKEYVSAACLVSLVDWLACEKRLFSQLFLCLSRACLGKKIVIYIYKKAQKEAFFAPLQPCESINTYVPLN